MIELYVGGKKVGTVADMPRLMPEFIANLQRVEFRDERGNAVGEFRPQRVPSPDEPLVPWDPTITKEELDRRAAEPGISFEEMKKRLGWE